MARPAYTAVCTPSSPSASDAGTVEDADDDDDDDDDDASAGSTALVEVRSEAETKPLTMKVVT